MLVDSKIRPLDLDSEARQCPWQHSIDSAHAAIQKCVLFEQTRNVESACDKNQARWELLLDFGGVCLRITERLRLWMCIQPRPPERAPAIES